MMKSALVAALAAVAVVTPLRAQAPVTRPLAAASIPLEQLCGPRAATTKPAQKIVIVAGSERVKTSYGPTETIVINAGTSQGVKAGQRYLVRRVIDDQFAEAAIGSKSVSIHTAGWVTILDAEADAAVAQITEACDTVLIGDYLEPFVIPSAPPPPPPAVVSGPDYARPARVILGDERRQLGGESVVMVIDRGSDHGIRVGQPLTVFRYTIPGKTSGPIATLGEAVVIEVHPETSLMRIGRSREAIEVGDLVAIHR
jgi:hypothetical protein